MPAGRKAGRASATPAAKSAASAAPFVPEERSLPVARGAVQKCRGCDLYRNATQAVFGEIEAGGKRSTPRVAIMMIGEQPGDHEDVAGPSVRRAGGQAARRRPGRGGHRPQQGLRHQRGQALQVGAARQAAHPQEAQRARDRACRPWLDAELESGAAEAAGRAGRDRRAVDCLDRHFGSRRHHGESAEVAGLPPIIATLHPSAMLRAITPEDRHAQRKMLVNDLLAAARLAA